MSATTKCRSVGFSVWWVNLGGGGSTLPMGLGVGLFFSLFFFFLGDIFWFFLAMILQQIGVCSDTKTDVGQPKKKIETTIK